MKRTVWLLACVLALTVTPTFAQVESTVSTQMLGGGTVPGSPVAGQYVSFRVSGSWPDSCIPRSVSATIEDHMITLNIYDLSAGLTCAMVISPWSASTGLGYLPAGTYDVYTAVYYGYDSHGGSFPPLPGGEPVLIQGPDYFMTFIVAPPAIVGDVNADKSVDVVDLLIFVATWGKSKGQSGYNPLCDFNTDSTVDIVDLLTLVETFGQSA